MNYLYQNKYKKYKLKYLKLKKEYIGEGGFKSKERKKLEERYK